MEKTAVITGGAGAIAFALAVHLERRGFRLILIDRDEARLDETMRRLGSNAVAWVADLTVAADLQRIGSQIESIPDLELLVNNAGFIRPGNVVDLTPAHLAQHIGINLTAPVMLSQAAVRAMARRRTGCVLSIVSAAGLVALAGSAAYSGSKFGLRGFLIALSQEARALGIHVNSVFPGAVDTPMLRDEATHGGSVLNFLNKNVLVPEQVALACLRAMDKNKLEVLLPASEGLTARLACAFPGLMPRLLPFFEKQGRAGLQRFLSSRGLTPVQDSPAPGVADSARTRSNSRS